MAPSRCTGANTVGLLQLAGNLCCSKYVGRFFVTVVDFRGAMKPLPPATPSQGVMEEGVSLRAAMV
jgi:hypothetical protein